MSWWNSYEFTNMLRLLLAAFLKRDFSENLYEVPFHSLFITGAYGHGFIKELLFGSRMEEIHTILLNNMLIVGPYTTV